MIQGDDLILDTQGRIAVLVDGAEVTYYEADDATLLTIYADEAASEEIAQPLTTIHGRVEPVGGGDWWHDPQVRIRHATHPDGRTLPPLRQEAYSAIDAGRLTTLEEGTAPAIAQRERFAVCDLADASVNSGRIQDEIDAMEDAGGGAVTIATAALPGDVKILTRIDVPDNVTLKTAKGVWLNSDDVTPTSGRKIGVRVLGTADAAHALASSAVKGEYTVTLPTGGVAAAGIVGGDVVEVFTEGPRTTLNGAIDDSQTTLTLTDPTKFGSGVSVVIGSEIIVLGAGTGATRTGCTRHANGTAAAAHNTASAVYESDFTKFYPVKAPVDRGEQHRVRQIRGDTLVFEEALNDNYSSTGLYNVNASVRKINHRRNIDLVGLAMRATSIPSDRDYGIWIEFADGVRIKEPVLGDHDVYQILLQSCLNVEIASSRQRMTRYDPGEFWTSTTQFYAGDVVKPTVANTFVYTALTDGISGGPQPTWPTTIGNTIVDGGVTWQCGSAGLIFYGIAIMGSCQGITIHDCAGASMRHLWVTSGFSPGLGYHGQPRGVSSRGNRLTNAEGGGRGRSFALEHHGVGSGLESIGDRADGCYSGWNIEGGGVTIIGGGVVNWYQAGLLIESDTRFVEDILIDGYEIGPRSIEGGGATTPLPIWFSFLNVAKVRKVKLVNLTIDHDLSVSPAVRIDGAADCAGLELDITVRHIGTGEGTFPAVNLGANTGARVKLVVIGETAPARAALLGTGAGVRADVTVRNPSIPTVASNAVDLSGSGSKVKHADLDKVYNGVRIGGTKSSYANVTGVRHASGALIVDVGTGTVNVGGTADLT